MVLIDISQAKPLKEASPAVPDARRMAHMPFAHWHASLFWGLLRRQYSSTDLCSGLLSFKSNHLLPGT